MAPTFATNVTTNTKTIVAHWQCIVTCIWWYNSRNNKKCQKTKNTNFRNHWWCLLQNIVWIKNDNVVFYSDDILFVRTKYYQNDEIFNDVENFIILIIFYLSEQNIVRMILVENQNHSNDILFNKTKKLIKQVGTNICYKRNNKYKNNCGALTMHCHMHLMI